MVSKELLVEVDKDRFRELLNKYTRRAFRMLPKLEKPRILDIGCGSGVPTIELAKLSGGEIVGIDINQALLDVLDRKVKDLQTKTVEVRGSYENEIAQVEKSLESSIAEREQRIGNTKVEREKKIRELDDLKAHVKGAVEGTKQAIGTKIMTFQKEFLDLMAWTLDNECVNELAPLTLLDVNVYIAKYDGESFDILTPRFISDESGSALAVGKPLSQEFTDALNSAVENWMKNDPTFKSAFESACIKGNVFLEPQSSAALDEGLIALERRNLIQPGDKERYSTLWSRYAGKCPKCGEATEENARFCQKCGLQFT